MKSIYANQLKAHSDPTNRFILLFGQDPFLVQESAQSLRTLVFERGFQERLVFTMENPKQFDWDPLIRAINCYSLFAEKQIIEWIWHDIPSKEADIAPIIAALPLPADTFLVIRAPALSKAQQQSAWIKALNPDLLVAHWPLQGRALTEWIHDKCKHFKLQLAPDVIPMIVESYQDRLFALEQLFIKLSLSESKAITRSDIEAHLDSQQFDDVFALQAALLSQKSATVVSLLNHYKQTKVELTLLLWLLNRLLHALEAAPQHNPALWLKRIGVWPKDVPSFEGLRQSVSPKTLDSTLKAVAEMDSLLKTGFAEQSWQHLLSICLELCGNPRICSAP